ncbi:MAG TPA: hypothetical protein PKE47_15675, partial [Verrucomicrobiota bacterium]|nr:hypothetical protein [Verrucomicrobiota bacterium]
SQHDARRSSSLGHGRPAQGAEVGHTLPANTQFFGWMAFLVPRRQETACKAGLDIRQKLAAACPNVPVYQRDLSIS